MIFLPRLFTKKLQFVSPEEKIHQELASVTGTVTNYKTNDNKSSFSNSESNCSGFFLKILTVHA